MQNSAIQVLWIMVGIQKSSILEGQKGCHGRVPEFGYMFWIRVCCTRIRERTRILHFPELIIGTHHINVLICVAHWCITFPVIHCALIHCAPCRPVELFALRCLMAIHGCRYGGMRGGYIPPLFRWGGWSMLSSPPPLFLYRNFIELRNFKFVLFWPYNFVQILRFFNAKRVFTVGMPIHLHPFGTEQATYIFTVAKKIGTKTLNFLKSSCMPVISFSTSVTNT